ncbi:XRE family transcriptional regulator [Streptomyces sp. BR123]|uniref:XRE family transcriptional regulator n=1 Tax=Streptomyces sp. BR123 TaxID=2749828 RepID=UPI0015C422F9|nr:XRE family transcriptional regulator [Streptomyces sp. BR123]NXY93478.1 XRE family transcriptional regulator [Streptomyces sp. BR123]
MADETPRPADSRATRTDLADLAQARMAELALSYRSLAASCVDPEEPQGGPLWTRGTLQNLINGKIKAPGPAELRALAAGLDLPLRVVQDAAAAQYFDLDPVYGADQKVRAVVRHLADLSAEDLAKVEQLIREAFGSDQRAGLD